MNFQVQKHFGVQHLEAAPGAFDTVPVTTWPDKRMLEGKEQKVFAVRDWTKLKDGSPSRNCHYELISRTLKAHTGMFKFYRLGGFKPINAKQAARWLNRLLYGHQKTAQSANRRQNTDQRPYQPIHYKTEKNVSLAGQVVLLQIPVFLFLRKEIFTQKKHWLCASLSLPKSEPRADRKGREHEGTRRDGPGLLPAEHDRAGWCLNPQPQTPQRPQS